MGVVGKMIPPTPKRCPYHHPCNLNYINIMWQRDFADHPELSGWAQSNHMRAENVLQPESDLKHERYSVCHYWRGPHGKHKKKCVQTTGKEMGTSVL